MNTIDARIRKVALVTGGSSGIGLAVAQAFAREGARVAFASRDPQRATAALDAIRQCAAHPESIRWIQADVTQAAQVEAVIQQTVQDFGRLDYAFNNGGSGGRGGYLHELAEEDWDCTIDGYLKSVWLCMKYELAVMMQQGSGVIVNNSSVDGERAFPWHSAYCAAKHGVLGLTKSAALQYALSGIRINAVCPGAIRTPPMEEMIRMNPEMQEEIIRRQPIGRLGEPDEVAQAVLWLCSEHASLVTATALAVDGGYLAV